MNNLPIEYDFKQCEYSAIFKPAISKILDLKPSKAHYSRKLKFVSLIWKTIYGFE